MARTSSLLALIGLGLGALWLGPGRAADPDDRFVVLGAERPMAGTTGPAEVRPGGGVGTGAAISSSFVGAGAAGPAVAGRYEWSGTSVGEDGALERRRVVFPEGPVIHVDAPLVARTVRDRTGGTVVRYAYDLRGALTPDGAHWLFELVARGEGRGGSFTVLPSLRYLPGGRRLTLTVDEALRGSENRRYEFHLPIGVDGSVVPAGD